MTDDYFLIQNSRFSTSDETWLQFAKEVTRETANLLDVAGDRYSLIEILRLIADKRSAFAVEQGHNRNNSENQFGAWRERAYMLGVKEVARLTQKHEQTLLDHQQQNLKIPALSATYAVSRTTYFSDNPLFSQIMGNLGETKGHADVLTEAGISPAETAIVNRYMRRTEGVKDASFFDIFDRTGYARTTFLDPADRSSLTSIYHTNNVEPLFFVFVEHPTPERAYLNLSQALNESFSQLLTDSDRGDFLNGVSSLTWTLNQLMPFIRGSAAILQIFTAALLIYRDIEPQRYHHGRMDVDAMSLPRAVFQDRFLSGYQLTA